MIPLWWLLCQSCLGAAPHEPALAAQLPVVEYRFTTGEDLDLDGVPDDWTRRKGPQFPQYVTAQIDEAVGRSDGSSLRIRTNGGALALYSPLTRIDGLHTYYLEAWIRTEGIRHDAAMISVSLLNYKRERVRRYLSVPVMGTGGSWQVVRLGPMIPDPSVRFLTVGVHLAPGQSDQHDLGGSVWIDDITVGRVPRMELESNFFSHFLSDDQPLQISAQVSGLDAGYLYELDLTLCDASDQVVAETHRTLTADPVLPANAPIEAAPEPQKVRWDLPRQPPGFYKVLAELRRDRSEIVQQLTTLAVVDLVKTSRKAGEFGWSIKLPLSKQQRDELPAIAAQGGINWFKYPLWEAAASDDFQLAGDVSQFLDRLTVAGVTPVGLLRTPPPALRAKFANNWQGVSEIFTMPPELWKSDLEPVVARFSSAVHHWQLGGDDDPSFIGLAQLPMALAQARREIQRISLNAQVGIPWPSEEPAASDPALSFVTLIATQRQLATVRPPVDARGTSNWVVIRPEDLGGGPLNEQAQHLARMLIQAKTAGAPAIYFGDVYHPQVGLLRDNGAPAELFLPWRTTTLALQGAEYLGEFCFPNGSQNAVFVRDGEAVIAVWSEQRQTESLYFGEQPVAIDLWGRRQTLTLDPKTGEQAFDVGPSPVLIRGASEAIARWRIAAQFESGRMKSEYGGHRDAILGRNTFPQGISGTVSIGLPTHHPGAASEWEAEPREWVLTMGAGETFNLPVYLTLPPNARMGAQTMSFEFRIVADRPYRFRVYRPYQVGLGDVSIEVIDRKLPDGRLEIEQIVTNRTNPPEVLNFRCTLLVPDARRQKITVTKLAQGVDRKFYYLPDAERYRGLELGLRLEQDGGRRVMNHRWKVMAPSENPARIGTQSRNRPN